TSHVMHALVSRFAACVATSPGLRVVFCRSSARPRLWFFFFFNDPATTEIYTLSLHDALPISGPVSYSAGAPSGRPRPVPARPARSEEHTSELQSLAYLVCRLLLEKKKKKKIKHLHNRRNLTIQTSI